MKRIRCWLVTVLILLLWLSCASAQEEALFTAALSTGRSAVQVHSTLLTAEDGETHWLFLPTFANLSSLKLSSSEEGLLWPWDEPFADGQAVNAPEKMVQVEEGVYSAILTRGEESFRLNVTQSANLRTLFFYSDDPINQGRAWIENCKKHENETTGAMALFSQTGSVDHADRVVNWRGRGNLTWTNNKKPYQLKLERKADLLQTGIPGEQNRTWVLRTDSIDHTLLHDQISLDLSREIGISEAGFTEPVDLYYDGEYRGIYLLCEKVEVANGRIEIADFDKIIEGWNQPDESNTLDALPVGKGTNAYGLPYTYVEGIDDQDNLTAGGYFLEMEGPTTLTDKCHFTLSNGSIIALKNPEYASADMVCFISEKMELLLQTLQHHGVDPQTGTRLEEIMDIESFARISLINEYTNNADGYSWSSSFFILPSDDTRFRAGPPWDLDLTFGTIVNSTQNSNYYGMKHEGWMKLFYGVPAFRDVYQRLLQKELAPCVEHILLGSQEGKYLKPFDEYANHIEQAITMSRRLWSNISYLPSTEPSVQTDAMKQFIQDRFRWFCDAVMAWDQETANLLEIESNATYLLTDSTFQPRLQSWSNADMTSWTNEMVLEATEEDYALWQFTATLEPILDYSFTENTRVLFNGAEALCRLNEDGTITATVLYEDPSYKPAYAYDEDIGMVFNLDYYMEANPDVAEEWDYDPVYIAEYFFDYGMEEGSRGNVFFRPLSVMTKIPSLTEEIGYYYPDYYWAFIEGAYEEWMPLLNEKYEPQALEPERTLQVLQELGLLWEE